jgi:hypothetical protein
MILFKGQRACVPYTVTYLPRLQVTPDELLNSAALHRATASINTSMAERDMKVDAARAKALVSQLQDVQQRIAAVAKGRNVSL